MRRRVFLVDLPEEVCEHGWCYGGNPSHHLRNLWRRLCVLCGFDFSLVETMGDFAALLGRPPKEAIVVVGHGNQFPVPPEFVKGGEILWEALVDRVSEVVDKYRWTLAIEGGYPFFCFQTGKLKHAEGRAVERFFRNLVPGAKVNCWSWVERPPCWEGRRTDRMRRAAEALGLRLPEVVGGSFGISINLGPLAIYYDNGGEGPFGPYRIVSAYELGGCLYIHAGLLGEKLPGAPPDTSGFERAAIGVSALYDLTKALKIRPKRVFVLCCQGVDIWTNPGDAVSLLERAGFEPVAVRTIPDFEGLLKEAPKGAVVFNCHGPCLPLASEVKRRAKKARAERRGYGLGLWEEWMKRLGETASKRRWIWVHTAGYPFFHLHDKKEDFWFYSEDVGLLCFLWGACGEGVMADCWAREPFTYDPGIATPEAEALARRFKIPLPPCCISLRAISTNVKPSFVVYRQTGRYGTKRPMGPYGPYLSVAAFKLGKGAFVHCGLDGSELVKAPGVAVGLLGLLKA